MIQVKKCTLLFTLILANIFPVSTSHAQNSADALAYLQSITEPLNQIITDTWSYTSVVAHGKSANKVENKRQTLLSTIQSAISRVSKLSTFNGDASLRDSVVSYLKLNYNIINQDYAKIVDMEEIAEQSYDLMEAYLLAQDKANEKLDLAGEMIETVQRNFAAANNITLTDGGDKLSAKLESANLVFHYYRDIYLIFFKSYKQDLYLMDAQNKGDVNAMEQNKNALLKYAEEGIAKLDTMKGFQNDITVKSACKSLLGFYKLEASEKVPDLINFYLVKDNYEKITTAFNAKPQSKRTQADVDQYNKAVTEYNATVKKFNAINLELNTKRSKSLDAWNETVSAFLDKHVPKD